MTALATTARPPGASRRRHTQDSLTILVPGRRFLACCEDADSVWDERVAGWPSSVDSAPWAVRTSDGDVSKASLGPRVCERCRMPFFSDLDFFVCGSCLRGLCGGCAEGCFACLSTFCHGHCRCLCRPGVLGDGLAAARKPSGLWAAGDPASGMLNGYSIAKVTYGAQQIRYTDFRVAVTGPVEDTVGDWPLDDSRMALWCLKGICRGHHNMVAWLDAYYTRMRYVESDRARLELRCIAEVMQCFTTYDRVNAAQVMQWFFTHFPHFSIGKDSGISHVRTAGEIAVWSHTDEIALACPGP